MNIEPHDLVHEFPDHQHTIRHLKMHDSHFARLFGQYNEIDDQIRQIEEGKDNASNQVLLEMKEKRVELKDTLYGLIQQAEATL
jgi:uncharacterized protein YdcH (DUF465 family)